MMLMILMIVASSRQVKKTEQKRLSVSIYSVFSTDCLEFGGDQVCHAQSNNALCEYDGGDCCSGLDENCWECNDEQCQCHQTGSHMCAGIM